MYNLKNDYHRTQLTYQFKLKKLMLSFSSIGCRNKGVRIKSLLKKSPEKIPLNAVEREPVPTRVLNPNASEASYKPKQRIYRKTKLKKDYFFICIFFREDFGRGDFIREPVISCRTQFQTPKR